MRVAMVATPAPLEDMRPAPGFLDGDMIRARLPLADAGFHVVDLDPSVDLAVQIEECFDRGEVPEEASVLFYASCRVLLGDEDEVFLTLDQSQPDTGDSLRDIALLFRERARGQVAFFLELRHTPDPEDPFRSATVVGAAKSVVASVNDSGGGPVELLVGANPVPDDDEEDRASALTRALIEAMDSPDADGGLTLARFFSEARESGDIAGSVRCFAHVKGRAPFEILPEIPRSVRDGVAEPRRDRSSPPPPPHEHTAEPEPAEEPPPIDPPEPEREPEPEPAEEPVPEPPAISSEPATRPRTALADFPYDPTRTQSIEVAFDLPEGVPETPPAVSMGNPAGVPETPPAVSMGNPAGVPQTPPAVSAGRPISSETGVVPTPADRTAATLVDGPRVKGPATKGIGASDHVALGNALKDGGDLEAALASYKRALGMLAPAASAERGEIYVHLGQLKELQDKRREAIATYEKALALFPPVEPGAVLPAAHRAALEARVNLNVKEGDLRAVAAAEDALLAAVPEGDRYDLLVGFGKRWHDETRVLGRARAAFEKARALRGDAPEVLERLAALYEEAGMIGEALAAGQALAEATADPRARAERYFALGKRCLGELHKEDLGLKLFDLALASEPTMLEPLELVARVLADRAAWRELEGAYRRMLDRMDMLPEGPVRRDITFELCLRLGLLFRDHLDEPSLALDAFEDALAAKPLDLATLLTTAELARAAGAVDRAAHHLAVAAAVEPRRADTYHALFDAYQKLRRPDQAFQAASVVVAVGVADERERFIFDEHKSATVPTPAYVLPAEGWAWLRPTDHEPYAEAVLNAVAPAAIGVRLAALANDGRLPSLDPALRQDPERSTVSIVRSFGWASHFLNVPAPAVYLNDDPNLALAAIIAEEPTVMVGTKAQRGRSPTELAFLVGRHLAYHVGSHRLLLYYPSIEDLTACFLAALRVVMPETPAPASLRGVVGELQRGIALRISETARLELVAAARAFEAAGSRVHLVEWASDVERSATRAGLLLSADLGASISVLRAEPRQVLGPDEKIADLLAFAVSEEHHALRESLGIAIQP